MSLISCVVAPYNLQRWAGLPILAGHNVCLHTLCRRRSRFRTTTRTRRPRSSPSRSGKTSRAPRSSKARSQTRSARSALDAPRRTAGHHERHRRRTRDALDESTVDDQHANADADRRRRSIAPARARDHQRQRHRRSRSRSARARRTRSAAAIDNDIVLTDIAVSRKHFDLRNDGGSWVIVDRGSGNGTVVNGNLEDNPFMLANGDVIEIGNTTFRFDFQRGRVDERAGAAAERLRGRRRRGAVDGRRQAAQREDARLGRRRARHEPPHAVAGAAPRRCRDRRRCRRRVPLRPTHRCVAADRRIRRRSRRARPARCRRRRCRCRRWRIAAGAIVETAVADAARGRADQPREHDADDDSRSGHAAGQSTARRMAAAWPRSAMQPMYARTPYPQATEIPPHSVHAQMLVVQGEQRRGDLSTAHVPPIAVRAARRPRCRAARRVGPAAVEADEVRRSSLGAADRVRDDRDGRGHQARRRHEVARAGRRRSRRSRRSRHGANVGRRSDRRSRRRRRSRIRRSRSPTPPPIRRSKIRRSQDPPKQDPPKPPSRRAGRDQARRRSKIRRSRSSKQIRRSRIRRSRSRRSRRTRRRATIRAAPTPRTSKPDAAAEARSAEARSRRSASPPPPIRPSAPTRCTTTRSSPRPRTSLRAAREDCRSPTTRATLKLKAQTPAAARARVQQRHGARRPSRPRRSTQLVAGEQLTTRSSAATSRPRSRQRARRGRAEGRDELRRPRTTTRRRTPPCRRPSSSAPAATRTSRSCKQKLESEAAALYHEAIKDSTRPDERQGQAAPGQVDGRLEEPVVSEGDVEAAR